MAKARRSLIFLFLLFGLVLVNRFWSGWGSSFDNKRMIAWDVFGYYLYLPAYFIYDDPGLEHTAWTEHLREKYNPDQTLYQIKEGANGRKTIMYPMGMSMLWSPFFFAAHTLAEPHGYPADGISAPYSWALVIAGLFYAFIGLWFLRKILLRYFSETITCIVLLLITMGTNYWVQTASDTVMPHSTLFAINVLILWFTIRWHETYYKKFIIGLAITLGLATLTRPTEVLWILIPILWTIKDKATLNEKIQLLLREWKQVVLFGLIFCAVIFPQLLYWKYTSDHWVKYTYQEHITLDGSFLIRSLFSYKKGWFLYTPIMLFAFWGFWFLRRYQPKIVLAVFVFVLLNVWVITGWECWWYATCFSNRALSEMYPAMTLPLGALVVYLSTAARLWMRILMTTAILFLLALNLFQVWQYNHYLLSGERMTFAFYWRMFGKTTITEEDKTLLEIDHDPSDEMTRNLDTMNLIYDCKLNCNQPEFVKRKWLDNTFGHLDQTSLKVGTDTIYSPELECVFKNVTSTDFAWIKSEAWVCVDDTTGIKTNPPLFILSYETPTRAYKHKNVSINVNNIVPGEWQKVELQMLTPVLLYGNDCVKTYILKQPEDKLHVDDVQMRFYIPKNK